MSDIDRVKEMVAEGRITAEEGDRLIKVLTEVDAVDDAAIDAAYDAAMEAADRVEMLAERENDPVPGNADIAGAVGAAGREAARIAREAAQNTARDGREVARLARDAARDAARGAREAARGARDAARELRRGLGATGASQGASARPGAAIAPPGTRWVNIEMLSGDIDVWAVDGLVGPEVEGGPGNINVEDTPDGYTVKFAPDRGGVLDRFLSHVRSGSLKIRIPSDHGVVVRATAGDIDLHGVRYLRGSLTAGDLDADALEGVDFSSTAGDLDVNLLLRSGNHLLTVGAGDVAVTLDERSNVAVEANVSIGDATTSAPGFSHTHRTVGAQMAGTLGSGDGRLQVRATTGDVSVKVARMQFRGGATTGDDDRV